MNTLEIYRDSIKEFRSLKTIIVCAMMLALSIVLDRFKIRLNEYLEQGISFIPLAVTGMMFGPFAGGIVGAAGDILKFAAYPTGTFFPGFTLNEILAGTIYGLFLYKRKITIIRCFIIRFVIILLLNIFLTPLWLSIITSKGYLTLLIMRIPKNAVIWPISAVLLYGACKAVFSALKRGRAI